ncbi:unnamed protein product, partial [Didymodactylos carnosus]
MQPSQARAR